MVRTHWDSFVAFLAVLADSSFNHVLLIGAFLSHALSILIVRLVLLADLICARSSRILTHLDTVLSNQAVSAPSFFHQVLVVQADIMGAVTIPGMILVVTTLLASAAFVLEGSTLDGLLAGWAWLALSIWG